MRVSLLKFEPRVSNFPALEAVWLLVPILHWEVFFLFLGMTLGRWKRDFLDMVIAYMFLESPKNCK